MNWPELIRELLDRAQMHHQVRCNGCSLEWSPACTPIEMCLRLALIARELHIDPEPAAGDVAEELRTLPF